MKKFVLAYLLLSTAAAHAQTGVTIVFSPKTKNATGIAQKWGKIVKFEPNFNAVSIRPDSAKEAIQRAKSDNKVLRVRRSWPELKEGNYNLNDAADLERSMNEMKERNADREAFAKASGITLSKLEKIKTGYYESHLFWLQQRAYPNKRIDYSAYRQAAEHVAQMPSAGSAIDSTPYQWEFIGPRNLDIPYRTYYGIRPINGRANDLAVDPSNPNTLYLASANGGVWKTTDGGTNWSPLTDQWPFLTVSSLAIDPTNPQIIYAGTGDFPGGKNFSMGIMKSFDGGASWTQYGLSQFGSQEISTILVDPENPQIVTISTGRGSAGGGYIWRSTNGGVSWTQAIGTFTNWFRITMGPLVGGTRTYYAAGTGSAGGRIYRSIDRGATWTQLTSPLTVNVTVLSICASKINPSVVYLLTYKQIFKSTNSGNSWTDVTGNFPHGTNDYNWSQFSYDWFFDCSSGNGQDILYVGAIDTVQSPDSGATWRSVGGPTYSGSALTHNDQHFVTVDPTNPNIVYMGGDGGAYRYTYNPTAGTGTWGYLSANLGISQFYRIAVHPSNPDHVMGGTQDNASPHSLGNLAMWENVGGGDGGFCAINPNSPATQYATSQNLNIYRTNNTWNTSGTISPSTGTDLKAFIAPIMLDSNNPNLLYAGTNYLWRRDAGTSVWEPRLGGQQLAGTNNTVRYIEVAPGDTNRIYTGSSDGQVWMSINKGVSWQQINTGTVSLPNRTITSISVNPANKDEILVSVSGTGTGHVWKCANTTAGVRTWIDVSGLSVNSLPNTPCNSVVHDAFDFDNTYWAATDLGVFVSRDGGVNWANATQPLGLPNTSAYELKFARDTNYLTLGTFGRGIWRLKNRDVLFPTSAVIEQGTPFGGNMTSLRTSDNSYYSVLSDESEPTGQIVFFGGTAPGIASLMEVLFETKTDRTAMVQFFDMKDFTTGNWVNIDTRSMSLSDARVTKLVPGDVSRFLQSGNVQGRFRFIPSEDLVATDGWSNSIDRLVWRTSP